MLFRPVAAAALLFLGAGFASSFSLDDPFSGALSASQPRKADILPRGYIVEFADDAEQHIARQAKRSLASLNIHEEFHKYMARSIAEMDDRSKQHKRGILDMLSSALSSVIGSDQSTDHLYTTREEFDHAGIFRGISVVLASDSYAPLLAKAPAVVNVSPIRRYSLPNLSPVAVPDEVVAQMTSASDQGQPLNTFLPHHMTGVDRLQAEGFLGNGTVIGIIDTGVGESAAATIFERPARSTAADSVLFALQTTVILL